MSSGWVDRPGRGVAKYQFPAKDDNQLSLNVGDVVEVKQENSGWFRGYLYGQPTPQLKLFPVSYVQFTSQAELDAQAAAAPQQPSPVAAQPQPSSPLQQAAATPRTGYGTGNFGQGTPSRSGTLLAQAQAGSQQQSTGASFFQRQQTLSPANPSQFLQQHNQQQATSAQHQPFAQAVQQQQQPTSPVSPQFGATSLQQQPLQQQPSQQPFVLGGGLQQPQQQPAAAAAVGQQPTQDVNTIRGYSSTGGIPTYNPEPKSKAPPTDMNTVRGFSSNGGIPTYNPEPKAKTVTAATPAPQTSNSLHFPQIFLDNRPNSNNEDKEHQGNQELGYILPKSRDGVRALQGTTDNIVEVLDAYKLIDPLSAQHMLIEDGTSPYRANSQVQNFDDFNTPLLQMRHAQQQSLSLSIDKSLRDTDPSSIVKLKKGPYDKTENRATMATTNALFPTYDATNDYISGECSLPPKRYQLFLNVNVCIFAVNEWTELYFSLYSHQLHRYVTEDYVVRLPPPGLPEHATILGRMKTIFRDLSPEDLKSDLWLVCRIYRNGTLLVDKKSESQAFSGKKDDKKKGEPTVRRCFGCAATYVSQANLTAQIGKKYEPPTNQLTIFVPTNETTFATFHEALILRGKGIKDSREFDTVPRAKGIALALTLYEGEIDQVREQNRSALKQVTDTMKLQLPSYWDIRLPRTELQVTLHGCFALQDKKASARNIEIRVKLVRNSDYQDVLSAIFRGNGASDDDEEPSPNFTSSVYYHSNTPIFNEMFKIRCPPQVLQECHLFFEMWHISTNPKKSACFCTSHLCITTPSKNNGPPRFIVDQEHSIPTYKPYSKDDNYLNPSAALKLAPRKGESITFSTQLLSTSLTSQATLSELRNWQTTSQQRCTQLLNGLCLTAKSQPITTTPAQTSGGLGAFGSPMLSVGGGDEPLVYIPTRQLRQNMQELLNTFLQILSTNDRIALHGVAFDAFVHVLSRLTIEARPMLDLYVNQLIRADYIPALWRLLGFTMGALDHFEHYVVTSVEAINAAGGQVSPAAAAGGNNQSNGPQTPSLKEERRPSAVPQFTLMGGNDSTPQKSIPQPPGTPSHRSQGIQKLDFDGESSPIDNGSQGNKNNGGSNGKLTNDDLTPLNRFTLALPYLLRIIVPLFSYFERTNQAQHLRQAMSSGQNYQRTQFAEVPATQTGGSTPFIQISGDGMVREEFRLRVLAMLDKTYAILGQNVATDQAKAIQVTQSTFLRSLPELLAILSFDNPIAPYAQLLSPEEMVGTITVLLTSITSNPSLSIDEMGAIKTFLTGIVGATGVAPDAMNTPVPVVHQLDTKNVHSVTSIGWHRHTVSALRSWIQTPKHYRAVSLTTPVLKALLPQFLASLQACVTAALHRGSLNEALLAVPVLEHIYSLIFAANRQPDDISAVYVQELHNHYFTGNRFAPQSDCGDRYDISTQSPSEVFPQSTYLQLLPTLITMLYHYVSMHPKIDLPKSDVTHRPLNLPEWRVANTSFVDIMPQVTLLIFSIFALTPKEDVATYFAKTLPNEQASNLLAQLLCICNGFTTFAIVPKVWLDLDVFQRTSIIGIVRTTSDILLENFNTPDKFHPYAWVYWLQLALSCKGPDFFNIQGSNFRAGHINSKIDRPAVERELIALFHKMWSALSPAHKVTTCPVLVERLIAIISSPLSDDEYKTLALVIYYQLLESEFATTKSFSLVERYTIDSLYEVANISPDRAHAAMDKMYNATWGQFDGLALADPLGSELFTTEGRKFLDHLKNLFSLMSSLFTHPSDPEWEYDRTAVALRLIRYIENPGNTGKKVEKAKEEIDIETASSSSSLSSTTKKSNEVDNAVQTRKAMHTRYIQYLVDLHVDHRNFAEAGISYIQQAKQLDWSQTMLDGSGTDFQPESESDRKVRLLDAAIDAFSKAHDYERCIQLIDYLRYYHQHITFNFSALSKQIQRQANFFNAMLGTTRVYSTYYRVVLYGRAAQDALQSAGNQMSNPNHTPENGIEFVYKGNTLEGISLFTDRLKKRFTDAFFHMSSDRPTPEMMAQHKSIVAIVALVVPPPETRAEVLAGCPEAKLQYEQARLPQDPTMIAWQWPQSNGFAQQAGIVNNAYQLGTQTAIPTDATQIAHAYMEPTTVINYRTNNRIYVFEYSKPWRRGEDKKPANEFLDLWLVRTYLIIEEPFPANRRRIEVIARIEKIQKPVQNAVEQVQNKTKELSTLIQEVMATPQGEISDTRKLSMILNGMIDAPVNGGNAKYIEAFLTPQFATADAVIFDNEKVDLQATLSERRKCQQELKTAFKQQFAILKEGVAIFERKADSSQLALIQHLKATYDATMIKLAPILD